MATTILMTSVKTNQNARTRSARLRIVHYDKTRFSEGSRVRSQMAASISYADSFLVLAAMRDEPREPHWTSDILVKYFISAENTLSRLIQEIKVGLWLAREARKGRFDILHAHHNTALVVALIWSLLCRKPFIFDSHDLFSPNQLNRKNLFRRFCSWFKWSILQGVVLRRAACAVHVSPGIVQIYQKLFPLSRHELLWNLPAFALASKDGEIQTPISEALKQPPVKTPLRLVYFGLLSSSRLSLPFLEMLATVPSVELNLYGRFFEEVNDYDEYYIGFTKIVQETDIRWHGTYTTSELPEILNRADLLILPIPVVTENNSHALPNKLFESCINGLGVLSSNACTDILSLAQEYGFGFGFDPHQPAAVKIALEELVSDPARIRSLKDGATRFASSAKWSPAAYKKALMNIYERASIGVTN